MRLSDAMTPARGWEEAAMLTAQARTISGCDRTIRIPMAHGVDSLNVAAASAVAFWQLCPHVPNDYHYRPGMFA